MKEKYAHISDTVDEMLTYFNRLYTEHDTTLQEYKAKLFEVNIRLEELLKTQNVYSLNTDYRKSVFSPIPMDREENEKEREIKDEIDKLTSKREKYEYSINEETIYLKSIDKRIKKLTSSKQSLAEMMNDYNDQEEKIKSNDNRKIADITADKKKHQKNLLMIDVYDDTYEATLLDKKIRQVISDNNHKLENVRGYIYSSPGRSKVLLDEITASQKNMIRVIDDQLSRLQFDFDENKPLREMLRSYVDRSNEKHPDIKTTLLLGELRRTPVYIRYITIRRLLDIIFDNIYKHSKATEVKLEASEKDKEYSFRITDNGVGIPADYKTRSQWYSGLHRAEELIYLLDGNITIKKSKGTIVEFSFKDEN